MKAKPQNHAGFVKLVSADPTDAPEINFMLFEEGKETDMGAMKDTVAWARKMYAAARGVSVKTVEPPCERVDAEGYCGGDEEWSEYIPLYQPSILSLPPTFCVQSRQIVLMQYSYRPNFRPPPHLHGRHRRCLRPDGCAGWEV